MLFNDIGTKVFWGEALTADDYTNILGFLEGKRQQIAAEFEEILPKFSEPIRDFTATTRSYLSDSSFRLLERGADICAKVLAAFAWLWEKIKTLFN